MQRNSSVNCKRTEPKNSLSVNQGKYKSHTVYIFTGGQHPPDEVKDRFYCAKQR